MKEFRKFAICMIAMVLFYWAGIFSEIVAVRNEIVPSGKMASWPWYYHFPIAYEVIAAILLILGAIILLFLAIPRKHDNLTS